MIPATWVPFPWHVSRGSNFCLGFDIIADKVPSVPDATSFAKASAEGGVDVVNASVENTDLDTLAGVLECIVDIVDAGHGVGAVQLLGDCDLVLQDLGLAHGNDLNGPDTLDTGDIGQILALVASPDVIESVVEDMDSLRIL